MSRLLGHPLNHSKGASIRKLGSTFAAEIFGLDLKDGLSEEAFQEIQDIVTEVSYVRRMFISSILTSV